MIPRRAVSAAGSPRGLDGRFDGHDRAVRIEQYTLGHTAEQQLPDGRATTHADDEKFDAGLVGPVDEVVGM